MCVTSYMLVLLQRSVTRSVTNVRRGSVTDPSKNSLPCGLSLPDYANHRRSALQNISQHVGVFFASWMVGMTASPLSQGMRITAKHSKQGRARASCIPLQDFTTCLSIAQPWAQPCAGGSMPAQFGLPCSTPGWSPVSERGHPTTSCHPGTKQS